MYVFPDETRLAYEAMPIPMAYYQEIKGKAVALLVSDGLCRLMKADRPTLIERLNDSLFERVHPDDAGRITRIASEFVRHLCGYDVIYRGKYAPEDDYRYIHSVARWQRMPGGEEVAVLVYTDISESESESTRLANNYALFQKDRFYSDALTGLPNSNFLREFADEKADRYRQVGKIPALLYIDVNGLRSYNNQYGYAEGDALLKLIADVLQTVFTGALISRGADDHFVVVADLVSEADLARRIAAANGRIRAGAYGNTRGIQAGISRYEPGLDIARAMDRATHAFKQIGNDLNISHCFYSAETEDDYWEQRYIVESFDDALKHQWIRVYYQAIMRLRTGKGCAMEALARWADPTRGLISPGEFIPVLEKYHLLHKLDLYMVEQICREMKIRRDEGLPMVPISVNFSAQDFDYIEVADALDAILDRNSVDRNSIIVEITEQDVAEGTESFKQQLKTLRNRGYHLWLDDFGSGYSSLNVLSQFDVDLVKFDLELLRHLDDHGGANRHIMKAMVALSRQLGIQTLAEGMEDESHRAFLDEIDCQLAQGFYFYRPQPLDAVLFMLKNGGENIPCETHEERQVYLQEWKDRMGRQ